MQSFIVLASLVLELVGGQNDPPLGTNVAKKNLISLRVKVILCIQKHIGKNIFLNLGTLGIFQVLATFFNLSFSKIL